MQPTTIFFNDHKYKQKSSVFIIFILIFKIYSEFKIILTVFKIKTLDKIIKETDNSLKFIN